jgi:hypothetical protein
MFPSNIVTLAINYRATKFKVWFQFLLESVGNLMLFQLNGCLTYSITLFSARLYFLIWIFLWHMKSSLWLIYHLIWNLLLIYHIFWNRNEYVNTSCPDALVPPHFLILTCEHRKEAHIKQSRHSSTVARVYYCCPYNGVSNNISHVWILCNLTLKIFFSCPSRICVDFFNGLMDRKHLI